MWKIVWALVVIGMSLSLITAQDNISPELRTQLDEIEAITSDLRELPRQDAITLEFPTRADLEVYLREQFDEEFATEEFADDLLFYVGLDLLEPDVDLESALFDFAVSQIAGYYDPEIESMNVILMSGDAPGDELPIVESFFYSHEYVHALQDQYFDLEALTTLIDESDNGDQQLAILALIEGDASQVMTEYMTLLAQEDPLALLQAVSSLNENVGLEIPDTVPEVITEELLFPYFQGQLFVAEIIAQHGWSAIDEAFTDRLPASTEQIYHPERYLAGELPLEFTAPDLRDDLDDSWRLAQDTSVGEFYLRQYLGTQLRDSQVRQMATGWGGDHMQLFVDDTTGDIIWVIHQIWDTPEDAIEFNEGFVEFLDLRFGSPSDDGTCWTGDVAICFTQIDEDETRISYAPDMPQAMFVLTSG